MQSLGAFLYFTQHLLLSLIYRAQVTVQQKVRVAEHDHQRSLKLVRRGNQREGRWLHFFVPASQLPPASLRRSNLHYFIPCAKG